MQVYFVLLQNKPAFTISYTYEFRKEITGFLFLLTSKRSNIYRNNNNIPQTYNTLR